MQDNKQKKRRRERYEKPNLRVIELATEEVLGVGCKTDTTGGYNVPVCSYGAPCNVVGGS